MIPLLLTKLFDTRNFQKYRKHPNKFFVGNRIFSASFPDMVHQNVPIRQMGTARNFLKHQKFLKTPKVLPCYLSGTVILWEKKLSTFLVLQFSLIYRSFRAGEISSNNFIVFSISSSLHRYVIEKEIGHFSSAFFFLQGVADVTEFLLCKLIITLYKTLLQRHCREVTPNQDAPNLLPTGFLFPEAFLQSWFFLFALNFVFDILLRSPNYLLIMIQWHFNRILPLYYKTSCYFFETNCSNWNHFWLKL